MTPSDGHLTDSKCGPKNTSNNDLLHLKNTNGANPASTMWDANQPNDSTKPLETDPDEALAKPVLVDLREWPCSCPCLCCFQAVATTALHDRFFDTAVANTALHNRFFDATRLFEATAQVWFVCRASTLVRLANSLRDAQAQGSCNGCERTLARVATPAAA
eukprot:13629620-Alexandrium_andersonii.AAC.2